MNELVEFFERLRNVGELIRWGGTVGLTAIVFAETGLLVGFFLPGDSLLVTAGLFAAQGFFNLVTLGILLSIASIAGNTVGYAIGAAAGPRLFTRENSIFFHKKHLFRAHDFYERHGGKTIILARFMPIVRTFVPVVAGMARMDRKRYTFYNVVGGLLWIWSMLFTGYFLGRYIPGIESHIEMVIIVVVLLSILPGIIGFAKARMSKSQAKAVPDA